MGLCLLFIVVYLKMYIISDGWAYIGHNTLEKQSNVTIEYEANT